jgi:hypothetical protein
MKTLTGGSFKNNFIYMTNLEYYKAWEKLNKEIIKLNISLNEKKAELEQLTFEFENHGKIVTTDPTNIRGIQINNSNTSIIKEENKEEVKEPKYIMTTEEKLDMWHKQIMDQMDHEIKNADTTEPSKETTQFLKLTGAPCKWNNY